MKYEKGAKVQVVTTSSHRFAYFGTVVSSNDRVTAVQFEDGVDYYYIGELKLIQPTAFIPREYKAQELH